MGHERVGTLPRTARWTSVVQSILPASTSSQEMAAVAGATLANVRRRYESIHNDKGVAAAFGFLVGLVSQSKAPNADLVPSNINLFEDPSAISLANNCNRWVRSHAQSLEYAELAQRAAGDVVASWTTKNSEQHGLFSGSCSAQDIWLTGATAAGFSEISRVFFAKFTERYLKYFLEREASATLVSLKHREAFDAGLREHVDKVSKHAFETSKITQSFAAGWYNNHVRSGGTTNRKLVGFLKVAFGKIAEELLREKPE
jgi:hypothetical protein